MKALLQKSLVVFAVVLGVGVLAVPNASATVFNLQDGNASADINTQSQSGMFNWRTDGVDHMFQQWFWYRVGSAGPEASIDSLTLLVEGATDTNFSGQNNNLFASYGGAGFAIDVNYNLAGGPVNSDQSTINESLTIRNTGNTTLDFHFFQYSDFDVGGAGGDQGLFLPPNEVRQWDPNFVLSETTAIPFPSRHELANFASTRNSLNDGGPTTLNNNNSASGDVTWAFQWDFGLAPNASFQIGKVKQIRPVPEPTSLILLGVGLAGLGLLRRKGSTRR